jgi:transposase-like protein
VCKKQFSAKIGTIFEDSPIGFEKWLPAMWLIANAKNGISSYELHRALGVTQKTAWFMLHRIREAMKAEPLAGMLAGTFVADETWIGGKPSNRHSHGYGKGTRGVTDKQPVFSLVHKESGTVRSTVVPTVTGTTLGPLLREGVDTANSVLHTDSARVYPPLGQEFAAHESVNHFKGEYVRGEVSTNVAEGYFSQLKRSIDGTHHHVSVEHLHRYLSEFDFRYNTRKANDSVRMRALMTTTARRLTYKPLIDGA